jgi:hypothetical protein
MSLSFACVLVTDPANLLHLAAYLVSACVAAGSLYWRFVTQWLAGIRGRDWPTVAAVIKIVSVSAVPNARYPERTDGYLGTLTYFYRNPELETGDYTRLFGSEAEARAWASPYQGITVMVHVDPRDPARSVLRKQDLEASVPTFIC